MLIAPMISKPSCANPSAREPSNSFSTGSTRARLMPELRAIPIQGIGDVRPGDDIASLVLAVATKRRTLLQGDVLVITHKVVSKAEGLIVPLASVKPSR